MDLEELIMSNNNLEKQQKENLIEVLLRYTEFLITRPGKCKVYEYIFNITDTTPIIGNSRPVPYSARAGVRKQIEQMMEDGILELSDSSFINPLTIEYRENKEPRICIAARRVNNVMLPDRARAPPIDEMLQQFHGVKYESIIYNKPTICNSGSVVLINNYKYALHVSDALCIHHQEHYKL